MLDYFKVLRISKYICFYKELCSSILPFCAFYRCFNQSDKLILNCILNEIIAITFPASLNCIHLQFISAFEMVLLEVFLNDQAASMLQLDSKS